MALLPNGRERRNGSPARRKAAFPVVRLPAARFSSPACGGGRVGVCCGAGGNGGRKRGKAPSRREALPRPLPQAGGEERGGSPARRKAVLPVVRLPAARSSSPACGGGRVGVCCGAGGNAGRKRGKALSRREALPRPLPQAGGEERGGSPARRKAVLPVVRLPAARSSSPACGGGRVGVCCRAGGNGGCKRGRVPSRREALPRPLPQAGGEEKGLPFCRTGGREGMALLAGGRPRFQSFDCGRPDPPPPLAGEAGWGFCCRAGGSGGRKRGKVPSRREALPRPLPQAGGEERDCPPAEREGEKGRLSCEAEGRASSRSIAGGPLLLPRLRGRPGGGSAAVPAEAVGASAAKPRRTGRPSPDPSRKREGRERSSSLARPREERRGGSSARRKVAPPVGCLPAARSSSPACGGGRVGARCRAGGSGGRGPAKTCRVGRPSSGPSGKREGRERGSSLARPRNERRGGSPCQAEGCASRRLLAGGALLLPRLRYRMHTSGT